MTEISHQVEFVEERPDHHYRTEIPNFVLDLLNPNQLAVYAHIKRIAGDSGRCWMSMKNLAQAIGIGQTTLRLCLHELSVEDFFIEGAFIKIIKRTKPDGSPDSNIIKINDVWRINGDHYRDQIRKQRIKEGHSPDEPPPSARRTTPPRDPNQGGSPNDDKQEQSQEEPSKETNKQDVVVVPPELIEKLKILTPFKFDKKVLENLCDLALEQIQNAHEAFKQYCENHEVTNPRGCLRNAIICQWKPNEKKVSKQELADRKDQKNQDVLKENFSLANQLVSSYTQFFNENYGVSFGDKVVHLRHKGSFHPLSLLEEGCVDVLAYYLDQNKPE